jgi:hypothetical protein
MLKSCPFCNHGEDGDILPHKQFDADTGWESWQMRCEWCGALGPEAKDKKQAEELWNERKPN